MVTTILIKWAGGHKNLIDVEGDLTFKELKGRLAKITNIPEDSQKILGFKAGVVRDDSLPLSELGLREGMHIMVIRSATGTTATSATTAAVNTTESESSSAVDSKPIFMEDMTAAQRSALVREKADQLPPPGICNLGNTCYLNAVLQLFRVADEAVSELQKLQISGASDPQDLFVSSLKSFFALPPSSPNEPLTPFHLVSALRMCWPQFASKSKSGEGYAQQDAEEFLTAMFPALFDRSPKLESLFGFDMEETFSCTEVDQVTKRRERFHMLSCITSSGTKPVDHMMQGIRMWLTEDIVKFNSELGRDAKYERINRLSSLPEYLIVKFLRFEWKAANSLSRTEGSKTKVCRRIQYPYELDIFELASDSLKKELELPRQAYTVWSEEQSSKKKARFDTTAESTSKVDNDDANNDETVTTELIAGHYELIGSVSHKGRSADSGHYVGWTRSKEDPETWWMCDDERVSPVKIKDIDMCGGRSDYHISIILLYKKKRFEATAEQVAKGLASSS